MKNPGEPIDHLKVGGEGVAAKDGAGGPVGLDHGAALGDSEQGRRAGGGGAADRGGSAGGGSDANRGCGAADRGRGCPAGGGDGGAESGGGPGDGWTESGGELHGDDGGSLDGGGGLHGDDGGRLDGGRLHGDDGGRRLGDDGRLLCRQTVTRDEPIVTVVSKTVVETTVYVVPGRRMVVDWPMVTVDTMLVVMGT